MLAALLRSGYHRVIETGLKYLATNDSRVARSLERVLEPGLPVVYASIAYRRGHLKKALEMVKDRPTSRVYQRASQMLAVNSLEDLGIFPRVDQSVAYSGRVLFALHSAPAFDPNGYSVRSCQILKALDKYTDVQAVAVTRLGYPWDLRPHSTKTVQVETRFENIAFLHSPDPVGIRQPELDYIAAYADYLSRQVDLHSCSVIHAHSNFLNGMAAVKAARRVNCFAIYEMRGLWHLTRSSADDGYLGSDHFHYCEKMEVLAAQGADRVVVISQALKNWLIDRDVPADKIEVVGNAASQVVPPGRRQHSQPSEALNIGYVGALTRYEGLDTLLKAFASLRRRGIQATLTIAGDGPDAGRLRMLAKKLKLTDCVKFLGRVPGAKVPELMQQFDVCPLPRGRFAVSQLVPPLKPYEIMAFGVPLIVSNVEPLTEIAPHLERGWVVEAGDVDDLMKGLLAVKELPQLFAKMAAAANEWVHRDATWQQNAGKYQQLYEGLDCIETSNNS